MPHYQTEKNVFKTVLAAIGLLSWLGLLNGCTEVVVPGAMAGGGGYYRYTTSNIAKETVLCLTLGRYLLFLRQVFSLLLLNKKCKTPLSRLGKWGFYACLRYTGN